MHHKGLTQCTFRFAQKIPNRVTLTAIDTRRVTHMSKCRCLLAFQVSQGLLPSLQLPLRKGADVHRVLNHICQARADALDASQLFGMPASHSWGPHGADEEARLSRNLQIQLVLCFGCLEGNCSAVIDTIPS